MPWQAVLWGNFGDWKWVFQPAFGTDLQLKKYGVVCLAASGSFPRTGTARETYERRQCHPTWELGGERDSEAKRRVHQATPAVRSVPGDSVGL